MVRDLMMKCVRVSTLFMNGFCMVMFMAFKPCEWKSNSHKRSIGRTLSYDE